MPNLSRRSLLAAMGATALGGYGTYGLGDAARAEAAPPGQPVAGAPRMSQAERKRAVSRLLEYFRRTGPELLRPPRGVLRYPSISPSLPGATYNTQLWDWDTLWTSTGLFRLAHLLGNGDLHRRVGEHARGSLLNFLDHQSEAGRIPIMIEVSNPDPFGCLKMSAPNKTNQAKPVMAQLALLVADELAEVRWLAPHFDRLLRFYDSWRLGNQSDIGLLVWGDDVAIGDDNDPTTFGRPFFSSANLLLNCLYYEDLRAAAELAQRLNRAKDAKRLAEQASEQGRRIQKYCWDPRDRFYYTVDVQCVDRRAELIPNVPRGMAMSWKCLPLRIQMFTGFLPLWCRLATEEQAGDLVKLHYSNPQTFNAAFGVPSLSKQETMYALVASSDPSDWLGPIWIIVNYFVWKGLQSYGYKEQASFLADKTLRLLSSDLAHNGSLNEYYDPDTGAPLSHKGFMDWDLLVLEMA